MKAILLTIALFFILTATTIAGSGYGLAECHNVMDQRLVAPGVLHVFVDKTCDMVPDIVMEYRSMNGQWVYTGRWWWL